ncbi:hypothetical protein TIFTF001_052234 [Ficus carica]|uniref:Uncharacterized protein n=1 Tax=Ficus carica TaxID=3494 RepID=A0AA88JIN8_FICCA|nr:hypothetical protein TIFTF001_052234 [Ficus carica]
MAVTPPPADLPVGSRKGREEKKGPDSAVQFRRYLHPSGDLATTREERKERRARVREDREIGDGEQVSEERETIEEKKNLMKNI